jgi:hypothetical protein
MTQLTLTSSGAHPLKPLVESAIQNELRIVEAGIQRTELRLRDFEARHGMSSQEFLHRAEAGDAPETLDFAEWEGECRLIERLREKAVTLQNLHIGN